MKSIILILMLSCCFAFIESIRSGIMLQPSAALEQTDNVTTAYFNQILDHFDSSKTFWPQRYYYSDKYWGGDNSPVFLMIGGEGEALASAVTGGSWVDWASKYKALLIHVEHRFYGKSFPTKDVSVENLKYLTSEQALADLAYFVEQWNTKNNLTTANKWIFFGGSYPGNLVAWSRLKYPQLVYGGISSSGPLEAVIDFYEYNNVVRNSLNYFNPGCADQVTKAIKGIQKLFKSDEGVKTFESKLQFCSGFDRNINFDISTLIQSLTNPVTNAVQYDKLLDKNSINYTCGYMMDEKVTKPSDRLINLYKSLGYGCVHGNYSQFVLDQRNSSWQSDRVVHGQRQWLFQTCNEFGYFQTSEYQDSLFSDTLPLEFSTQTCTDIFGPEFNLEQLKTDVAATNKNYGGIDIVVDRIVFIQGSVDPWYPLGMVRHPTKRDPLLFVTGTSHVYDQLSPRPDDPPSLTAARETADRYINKWLKE